MPEKCEDCGNEIEKNNTSLEFYCNSCLKNYAGTRNRAMQQRDSTVFPNKRSLALLSRLKHRIVYFFMNLAVKILDSDFPRYRKKVLEQPILRVEK